MLTLYQFRSCPFCGKVRAFLNHTQTPFEVVEVTPFGMKELDFTEHRKVPVLRDGEQVIVESAAIVQHLNQHHATLPVAENAEEWMQWVDNKLVHFLPLLVHPDFRTSFSNFATVMSREQIAGIKGFVVRLGGAVVMPKVARKMKAKHQIEDATAEFAEAIDHWVNDGLVGKRFFAGEQPGQVDTSVFGVLHSVDGLGILEREKARNEAFARWYDACAVTMAA
ncbi:MAG: glutathione S-transferase N-terminal domain-containing protein [Thiolinea sp.]